MTVVYRADNETRSFADAAFVAAVQQGLKARQDPNLVVDGRWGNTTSTAMLAYARAHLPVGVIGTITSWIGIDDAPLEALRIETDRSLTGIQNFVGTTQIRAGAALIEQLLYNRDVNFAEITVISGELPYSSAPPGPSLIGGSTASTPSTGSTPGTSTPTPAQPGTSPEASTGIQPSPTATGTLGVAPMGATPTTGMPAWGWLLIGTGAFAAVGGAAYYMTKKKEAERR